MMTMILKLDCCSDVCGDIDSTYYAPTDIEFMHELHGPDNCGVYCQLRYEIRPYGCFTPTDGPTNAASQEVFSRAWGVKINPAIKYYPVLL